MTLYVLYESASGYGLFSADGIDEIGQNTEAVRSSVVDLNRFGKVVKLAAFTPYDSALDALNQCNAISEGQMTDELRNFLELTLPKVKEGKKPKFSLGVAEPKLGSHIFEVTKIPCQSNEFVLELIRGIRLHFDRFIENLKPGDLEKAQLGLGHSYSRAKMESTCHTARRRLGPSATPEDVVRTYREYWMHWGDDLGEFLMQYLRHWKDARVYGVTDFDGVKRLLTRLPVDWEDYAREVSGDYIYRVYGDYDLIGDLPRFISHLTYVYTVYGVAPRGPYLPPREYTWHDDSLEWLYTEVPRVVDPVIPRGMEAGGRPAHVTMGSRPRVLGRPVFPPLPVGHPSRSPLSVLPPMMASPPRVGSYRQTARMRVSDARDDYSPIRDIHAYGDDGAGPSSVCVREDDSDDDSDEEEDPEEDPEEYEDE